MAVSLDFETTAGDPVMGIDEAGRGPLAGGVYAAAVSVPLARARELLSGAWAAVTDSKKLTARRRDALAAAHQADPAFQVQAFGRCIVLQDRGLQRPVTGRFGLLAEGGE